MSTKVLLVEDDLFLRQLYADLLAAEQYNLDTAEDGKVAYEKMKQGGWDLVLLDMNLPEMSGIEVINKLKSEMQTMPFKKVVFLTNSDNQKDIEEIQKLSDGFLLKSDLNPEQFVEKVKQYI
jgi:two-component system chemotaxis response regulator CheY